MWRPAKISLDVIRISQSSYLIVKLEEGSVYDGLVALEPLEDLAEDGQPVHDVVGRGHLTDWCPLSPSLVLATCHFRHISTSDGDLRTSGSPMTHWAPWADDPLRWAVTSCCVVTSESRQVETVQAQRMSLLGPRSSTGGWYFTGLKLSLIMLVVSSGG